MIFDPTTVNWLFVIVGNIIIYSLFFLNMYLSEKIPVWITRKIGHISLHFFLAFFPYFFVNLFDFIIFLALLIFMGFFLSFTTKFWFISKIIFCNTRNMNGETSREFALNAFLTSLGAIIIFLLFHNQLYIYTASLLSLSLGDGFGELIGRPFGTIKFTILSEKSLIGTVAVFLGIFLSLIIAFVINTLFSFSIIYKLFIIALVGTTAELFNYKYLDNLFVPFSVAGSLFLLFEV